MTDDLDGSTNAEPVEFSYRGTSYTIDLAKKNQAALDKLLKPYISAATTLPSRGSRPSAPGQRGRRNGRAAAGGDVALIREWAAKNGHAVNARGRISQLVRDAYEAAN